MLKQEIKKVLNEVFMEEGLAKFVIDCFDYNQTFKGKREGFWRHYYDSGELKSEGMYNNDKENGIWRVYYKTGEKKFVEVYENGKLMKYYRWYKNGEPWVFKDFNSNIDN